MTVLEELLHTMDAADVGVAQEALESHGVNAASIATGTEMLRTFCDAFGLDSEDVARVAFERGRAQVMANLELRGVVLPRWVVAFIVAQAAGSLLIGLRLGLMVADQKAKAGGS